MPVVHLIRHGQASYGGEDYDVLSPLGAEQSARVAAELLRRGVEDPVLVSGDLARQYDTLRILADAAGYGRAPKVDPRWNEYRDPTLPAADAGMDRATYQQQLEEALALWIEADSPQGWRGFQQGAVSALYELSEGLGSGDVGVVVTSGGTITSIVARMWGLDLPGTIRAHRTFVNTSITSVAMGRQGMSLLCVNDHGHLLREDGLLTYR